MVTVLQSQLVRSDASRRGQVCQPGQVSHGIPHTSVRSYRYMVHSERQEWETAVASHYFIVLASYKQKRMYTHSSGVYFVPPAVDLLHDALSPRRVRLWISIEKQREIRSRLTEYTLGGDLKSFTTNYILYVGQQGKTSSLSLHFGDPSRTSCPNR